MNSPRHLPLKGCGKVVQAACGGTQVAILNGQFTQSNRKNNKSGRFVSEKFPLHCLACRIKNAFSSLSLEQSLHTWPLGGIAQHSFGCLASSWFLSCLACLFVYLFDVVADCD